MSHLPKVSRYGIMAITSSLLWNHAPSYSGVELLPTKFEPFIIRFFPSPLICVSCLSSRDVLYLTPWVDLECSIFVEIDSCRISFCRHHVGWRSQEQRRQDQDDAMNQHSREGQLDREDCDSFVTLLPSYLMSWISGQDSCLVGVSCHIPTFTLT